MRRLPELLLLVVCAVSAWAYSALPSSVTSNLTWLLPHTASVPVRDAPRLVVAFLIPAVLVLLLAAFRWATSETGRAASVRVLPAWLGTPGGRAPEYERFMESLDLVFLGVIALISGLHLGFLASAAGWNGPIAMIVGVVLGVSLASIGNVMPRLRPNAIAGLRTEALLNDPIAWRNAHSAFGRIWVAGGAIVVATALLASQYSLVVLVAVVLISLIAAPFVSRRARDASARSGPKHAL